MRRLLWIGALVAAWPVPLGAQSPCDTVAPTVYREPAAQLANLRVGWCVQPLDTNGVVITEPLGFALTVNGGAPIDLGLLQPLVGPNAAGLSYYEATTPALAAGVITVQVYTASLGMSAPSDPVTLTLLGSPKKPTNTTIGR